MATRPARSARLPAARSYAGRSAEDRRAERRVLLLAAARRAWGQTGLAGVTVRGVCALAGLTDRYFYESFTNREDVVLAVADQLRDEMLAVLVNSGLAAAGEAEAKLRAGLRALLDAVVADPSALRILTSDPTDMPRLVEHRREMLAMLTDLVIQYAPAVLPEPLNDRQLRRAALFSVGGVNQLIESWANGSIISTTDELAAECAQLCMRALTPPKPDLAG